MKNLSRKKRLVENEIIFREVNKSISEFLKETDRPNQPVPFYCECSRPNCIERINLTPQKYSEIHKNSKHFVILNGHEFLEVEKVIKKTKDYRIVEKHLEPPKASNIDLSLKSIASQF